jgi:DsbC/DsbD-like thiol-disulfide interchange protein
MQRTRIVEALCGRWRPVLTVSLGVVVALGCALCSYGQSAQPIVTAKMVLASDAVHPGSTARAAVIAQIAPGYHINDHLPTLNYLIPTELKFGPEKNFLVESISYPKGKLQKFVFAENGLSVYEGRLVIPALLRVASGAGAGDYTLRGRVTYQACNANACFPPASADFTLPVRVVGQNIPVKSANSQFFGK